MLAWIEGGSLTTVASLTAAFATALARPTPPWERLAGITFAGARSRHRVTMHFGTDVDWAPLAQQVAARLARAGARGRAVTFTPRAVVLELSGTSHEPPDDDGGVQAAVLSALLGVVGGNLVAVATERWSDGPFEDAPARERRGAEARAFLAHLLEPRVMVRVVELDFFGPRESANPEVSLVVSEPGGSSTTLAVRARKLPAECFVRPGVLRVHAVAPVSSFPGYASHLRAWAHEPLWTSPELAIDAAAFNTVELRAGVPPGLRALSDLERAFFGQRFGAEDFAPPPAPRELLTLERR